MNMLLILVKVDNIHVIPDLIDVTKFTKAVSRALSRFPTLAGRIRHDKRFGTWWVSVNYQLKDSADAPIVHTIFVSRWN